MEGDEKVDNTAPAATTTAAATTAAIESRQPLKIDYDVVLSAANEQPPPEFEAVPSAGGSERRRRPPEKRNKSGADSQPVEGEDFSCMSEAELQSQIERRGKTFAKCAHNLPDKGAKLEAQIKQLRDELERRKLCRSQESRSGCKKASDSESPELNGALDEPKQQALVDQPTGLSAFAAFFMKKKEDNLQPKSEPNTDDREGNAIDGENLCASLSDKRKRKRAGQFASNKRTKPELLSDKFSAWNPCGHSRESRRYKSLNSLSGRPSSLCSMPPTQDRAAGSITEKDASQACNLEVSKSERAVVLVVEEELDSTEQRREDKWKPSRTNELKIYYPSREDPESLEILLSELRCLEPGECLTSTIMNFYIMLLQQGSPTDMHQQHVYFFNTYFYSKLQKAVAFQKNEKEALFTKFRRWWRGVNIFKKAYIFLPVNEDNHWSLVVICIPAEEDESGPIILHLDSLGLHCSRSIFNNIRR